jgi:solute:Na+ symporter, SSS family
LMSVGAGTGLIYLLRWFWWRINAWSEISAMISSFLVALGFFIAGKMGSQIPSHVSLLITVATTSVVWILVTLMTKPTDRATLVEFYRRTRPAGPGWRAVRAEAGVGPSPDSIPQMFLAWMFGCLLVYSALFATGSYLYGNMVRAAIFAALSAMSAVVVWRIMAAMFRERREGART